MDGVAGDIRVLARLQVETFDRPEVFEDVESPKHGRAADPESPRPGLSDEIGGRERAGSLGDDRGKGAAGLCQAIPRTVQRRDVVGRSGHGWRLSRIETESQL